MASVFHALAGTWGLLTLRQKFAAVVIAVLSVGASMFELAALSTTVPFVSLLMDPKALDAFPRVASFLRQVGIAADQTGVTWLGAVVVAALFLAAAFRLATNFAVEFFALRITNSLVRSVMDRTLRAPYGWLKGQNVAALSQRITTDAATVGQTIYPGGLELLYSLAILLLGLGVVLANAPPQALLAIAAIAGLSVAVFAAMNPAMARQASVFRDRVVEANRLAFETFEMHKAVKVAAVERTFVLRYIGAFRDLNLARLQMTLTNKAVPMLTLLLGQIGLVVVSLALLHSGMTAEALVAQLTFMVVVVARVLPTAAGLSGSINKMIKAVPHYDGLIRLLGELDGFERAAAEKNKAPVLEWRTLSLHDIVFRHPGAERDQLVGLSLEFQRGGRYGIVGPSGSGKSTLIDILLRLVAPTSGVLRLDGQDISAYARASWLSRIGYVGQEIPIVDDTVRRNVAFGIDDSRIDDARVWRALADAGLADEIRSLPAGLDAAMGQAGGRMSGGQRQRLAIARALYNDVSLILLDEATSGLDPATEASVLRNLLNLPREVTLIMVTHRLGTTALCDKVYVLMEGRLAENDDFLRNA
jgi:ABC-type bacteriocin/lantibiotic exporter with double-glycine peptidase domain